MKRNRCEWTSAFSLVTLFRLSLIIITRILCVFPRSIDCCFCLLCIVFCLYHRDRCFILVIVIYLLFVSPCLSSSSLSLVCWPSSPSRSWSSLITHLLLLFLSLMFLCLLLIVAWSSLSLVGRHPYLFPCSVDCRAVCFARVVVVVSVHCALWLFVAFRIYVFFVWLVDCLICLGERITFALLCSIVTVVVSLVLRLLSISRVVASSDLPCAFVSVLLVFCFVDCYFFACFLSCRCVERLLCAFVSVLLVFCSVDCYFFACFRFLCLILALYAPSHLSFAYLCMFVVYLCHLLCFRVVASSDCCVLSCPCCSSFVLVDCYFFACFRFLCLILALYAPSHHLLCFRVVASSDCCVLSCPCGSSFVLLIVISLLAFAFCASFFRAQSCYHSVLLSQSLSSSMTLSSVLCSRVLRDDVHGFGLFVTHFTTSHCASSSSSSLSSLFLCHRRSLGRS